MHWHSHIFKTSVDIETNFPGIHHIQYDEQPFQPHVTTETYDNKGITCQMTISRRTSSTIILLYGSDILLRRIKNTTVVILADMVKMATMVLPMRGVKIHIAYIEQILPRMCCPLFALECQSSWWIYGDN